MDTETKKPLSHRRRSGSEKRQKERRITLRVTDEEYARAEAAAEAAGLTLASFARLRLVDTLQTRSRRRVRADVQELSRLHAELRHIGGNLNQIARALNIGEMRETAALPETLAQVQETARLVRRALGLTA